MIVDRCARMTSALRRPRHSKANDFARFRGAREAAATQAPVPQVTPQPTAAPQPAYFTYTIQPGDTVGSIAAQFGIDQNYILWNNPHVSTDPNMLIVGGTLVVPSTRAGAENSRVTASAEEPVRPMP